MSINNKLADGHCIPCSIGTKPLEANEVLELLQQLGNNWCLNTTKHLYREFKFNDFMTPIKYANKIAELAENEGHHPDLKIAWGLLAVEIWTHKINGLSHSDFVLAAKINKLII